jgi:hypothetical protein
MATFYYLYEVINDVKLGKLVKYSKDFDYMVSIRNALESAYPGRDFAIIHDGGDQYEDNLD